VRFHFVSCRRAVILGLLLLTGCASSSTSGDVDGSAPAPPTGGAGTTVGLKAREIEGADTDGTTVKLSQYRGKVVLVDFWATWCGPCIGLIPHEKKLVEKYKNRPFVILGVSNDHSLEDLQRFLKRDPLPWPNIFDKGSDILNDWLVQGLPTLVLVDAGGNIVGRWVGAGEPNGVDQAVEKAVKRAEGK
jgi:thiol-disulfide isomerase/thioredoxin